MRVRHWPTFGLERATRSSYSSPKNRSNKSVINFLFAGKDVELSCELTWSVSRLKEEIQRVFEGNPKPGECGEERPLDASSTSSSMP